MAMRMEPGLFWPKILQIFAFAILNEFGIQGRENWCICALQYLLCFFSCTTAVGEMEEQILQ